MSELLDVTLHINGQNYPLRLEPRRTLLDAIRDECGLTDTHMGHEHGVCGACAVLVDGERVRACLMFRGADAGKRDHPRPNDRSSQRRAARDARRIRPSGRLTRCAGIVRRSQGAAPQPRCAGANVWPQLDGRGAERRQCRWRVRNLRRASSRLPATPQRIKAMSREAAQRGHHAAER